MILERLSGDAALAVLADIANRNSLLGSTNEAERVSLYEHTAGNPLLLNWVAGQLGRGRCRTIESALELCRSAEKENDPLEFIFGDLVEEFSENETKALCALTYFNGAVKLEHICMLVKPRFDDDARALPGTVSVSNRSFTSPEVLTAEQELRDALSAEEIQSALDTLANRSLVLPDQESKAYGLVPMVADFLRRRKANVIDQTGATLEKRVYAMALENGYKRYDRFSVLEANWPTIEAALPLFLTGPNERLQTICDALNIFFGFSGHWDNWLALNLRAEARALAEKDFARSGRRAYVVGGIYEKRREPDAVLASARRAQDHWKLSQVSISDVAEAIHLEGHGYNLRHDYPAAIKCYQDAFELNKQFWPMDHSIITDMNCWANTEMESGDFKSAEERLSQALSMARTQNDEPLVAVLLGTLAEVSIKQTDFVAAEGYCREALPEYENLKYLQGLAGVLTTLAESLVAQGRKGDALPHARRAVEIYTNLRSIGVEQARMVLAQCEV